jgi:hypothetical protein
MTNVGKIKHLNIREIMKRLTKYKFLGALALDTHIPAKGIIEYCAGGPIYHP